MQEFTGTAWLLFFAWIGLSAVFVALISWLTDIATRILTTRRERRQRRREMKAWAMLTHPANLAKTGRCFVTGEVRR